MNKFSATVTICEAELHGYMEEFESLSRVEVLRAIVHAGPWRKKIEAELALQARMKTGERAQA